MFPSSSSIQPYLEPPRIGPTSLLLRELATRLGCVVVGGYPEKVGEQGEEKNGYNSAMVIQKDGEVIGNYRKAFLFETDKTWAREGESSVSAMQDVGGCEEAGKLMAAGDNSGEGFGVFELGQPLGRAVVGICMGEAGFLSGLIVGFCAHHTLLLIILIIVVGHLQTPSASLHCYTQT